MEHMENGKRGKEPAARTAGTLGRVKKAAGLLSVLLATVLAGYVGIWKMLIQPLAGLYLTYQAGQLTVVYIVLAVLKCWLSLTVAGFIWSIGYMVKCMLD